ncbi:MAG: hypothetical protein IT374_15110 [Polyangiaceae bacterium]|nr:hypothetical protein [Polyangiaceae bacterium]
MSNDQKLKETTPDTPAAKAEEGHGHGDKGGGAAAKKYLIPSNHAWAGIWKIFVVVALVGAGMTFAGGAMGDLRRFSYSYLVAFAWGVTLALGGLFFVLVQHITNAGWSVTVRRVAEHLSGTIPLFVVLFIPIMLLRKTLYADWMGPNVAHAVVAKRGYLNETFWIVRAIGFFGIWLFLSGRLVQQSREQDESRSFELTRKMRALSAPGIPLFALSLTFGGIDWFMTLSPAWFSTMYGVYIFAGAVVSMFAFLTLVFTRMNTSGLLTTEVNGNHFHDLGKLMFAFTVFWAYIAFAQYLLIWYANIPEETEFFLHRQTNGWDTVGYTLVIIHFFVPFFLMLSRHTKYWAGPRAIGAVIILVMHWVDLYWLIMPNHDHHFHLNVLADLGPWLFVMGVMLAYFFKNLAGAPIIPIGDPRLERSLAHQNA